MSSVLWLYLSIWLGQGIDVFVSRNGTDGDGCGPFANHCGTLYYASLIIYYSEDEHCSIHVIDGQNRAEIEGYFATQSTASHPCLPYRYAFRANKSVTITFDPQYINDFNDWFVRDLCDNPSNVAYSNKYMFYGSKSIEINHLIINDYHSSLSNFYNFIGTTNFYNASISCNDCVFGNIASPHDDKPLLYTYSRLHLDNSSFHAIQSDANIIYAHHSTSSDRALREIMVTGTSFKDVSAKSSVLNVSWSANDVNYGMEIRIKGCQFKNISSYSIIYDDAHTSNVTISDTSVDIKSGSIYLSQHVLQSSIDLYNISIIEQVHTNTTNDNVWFSFSSVDTVNITTMDVMYLYDADVLCEYSGQTSNSVINASASFFICKNPSTLIYSLGTTQLNHITIDVTIVTTVNVYADQFTKYSYDYGTVSALITNGQGNMNINNMLIKRTTGFRLVRNLAVLSVYNLSFDSINHNPTELHSYSIIEQAGIYAFLSVHHSNFIGTSTQIALFGGKAQLFHSIFQQSAIAISIGDTEQLLMVGCEIKNNGLYYGPFTDDRYYNYMTAGMQVHSSYDITLINNSFAGFDRKGLLDFYDADNIFLKDNTFNVNADQLFYNVPQKHLQFRSRFAPLNFEHCTNTTTISNEFQQRNMGYYNWFEWIMYRNNYGTNCLSANIFVNRAFRSYKTNITSCLRPALINCINIKCTDPIYGSIDKTLFNEYGIFIIDSVVYPVLFIAVDSNIALDNMRISVTNRTDLTDTAQNVIFILNYSNIFIIDSYIMTSDQMHYDISYDAVNCNVTINERLTNQTNVISKLSIRCLDSWYDSESLQQVMHAQQTQFMDHLSASKLILYPTTHLYFPGQLLPFEYRITDRTGNDVDFIPTDGITVDLELESGSFKTQLYIDRWGRCSLCDQGALIYSVSIQDSLRNSVLMQLSVENDILVLDSEELSVNITGCPIGYGSDGNNFTCSVCDRDYFNLVKDNVNYCTPCDSDNNPGVSCAHGIITILPNYWMGFVDEANEVVISAKCPSKYCCS
eukprot:747594_1